MVYTPTYPGGWQSGVSGATPITAAALENMEDGIAAADLAASEASAAASAVADTVDALAIPDSPDDIGAQPFAFRTWDGTSWSARPTVSAGVSVECFSDGTYGSTADAAATAPPDSVTGDIWWRKSS